MNRTGILVTGFAGVATTGIATAYKASSGASQRSLFEWRQYHLLDRDGQNLVGDSSKTPASPQ